MVEGRTQIWRACAVALALVAGGVNAAGAQADTKVPDMTLYPRVVELEHSSLGFNGRLVASSTKGTIVESIDQGATWSDLGAIPSPPSGLVRCCGTLFELPVAIGSLPRGALLYAATDSSPMASRIDLYVSLNGGSVWSYTATPVTGGPQHYGVFEPELTIGRPGPGGVNAGAPALIMYYSDETESGADPATGACGTQAGINFCQKLSEVRTFNGVAWSQKKTVLASSDPGDRPGMPRVTILPDGMYFMVYEFCKTVPNGLCIVHYRLSSDGWRFNTSDPGTPIVTEAGEYFSAAPAVTWLPLPGTPYLGAIVATGQHMYQHYHATGLPSASPLNGDRIAVTLDPEAIAQNGQPAATWRTLPAPVQVPDNLSEPASVPTFCANYASALVVVRARSDDRAPSLLELANDLRSANGDAHCSVYSGALTLQQLLAGLGG